LIILNKFINYKKCDNKTKSLNNKFKKLILKYYRLASNYNY